MANWIGSFLQANPTIAELPVYKRARRSIHFRKSDNSIIAFFTGAPIHYHDGLQWQPIDTSIVDLGNGYWGAAGLIVRVNKTDRTVEIVGTGYSQRTARVAVLRPSTMALRGTPVSIPVGAISDDSAVATGIVGGAAWEHRLRLTEEGVRETLTLASKPTLTGVQGTDYLVLETVVSGVTFPDGEVGEVDTAGMHFPLPRCTDAGGNEAPIRRIAKTIGGVQYLYTGIPLSWLATAVYPVVLDPDFAESTADGYTSGDNSAYATARATSTVYGSTEQTVAVGQRVPFFYYNYRAHLKFDTSAIGAGSTITQVNLKLVCTIDASSTDFNVQIVKQNWASQDPLSDANREAAYDGCLAAANDVTWRNTLSMSINTQYTSPNMDTTWPSKTGNTYYGLISEEDQNNSAPTNNEYVEIASQNNGTAGYRPVLTIAYSAGGADLNVSISDTSGVTDSPSFNGIPNISKSDTAAVSDAITAQMDALALSVSDTAGVADTVNAVEIEVINLIVSVSDTSGVTDTEDAEPLLIRPPPLSDTTAVTDTATVSLPDALAVSVSETAGVTDTLSIQHVSFVSVSDTAGATDTSSAAMPDAMVASVADTAAVTDAIEVQHVSLVSVSDAIGTTDTPSTAMPDAMVVSVADTAGVTDSPTAATDAMVVSVAESVGATDSPTVEVPVTETLTVSVADTVGATDTADAAIPVSLSASDAAGATDTATAAVSGAVLSVSDTAGATDTAAVEPTITVSLSDAAGVSDTAIVASISLSPDVSDSAGASDSTTVELDSRLLSVSDTVGATDTPTVERVGGTVDVSVSDTAGVTDTPTLVRYQDRPAGTLTVQFTTSVRRSVRLGRDYSINIARDTYRAVNKG